MSDAATWIRTRRAQLGMSRRELAERSGVSVAQLSNIETGRTQSPRRATLERLVEVLDPDHFAERPPTPQCSFCPVGDVAAGAFLITSPRDEHVAVCRDCVRELVGQVAVEERRRMLENARHTQPSE